MKYDVESCEYLSLAGTIKAQVFENWINYTAKITSHSPFLKILRLEQLSDQQLVELKEFLHQLCGTDFANHQLYAVTPDAVETMKRGSDSYYAIDKIHEKLGFLPNEDLLMKTLAEELMKFTDTNVKFNMVDQSKTFYQYFKGARIENENTLIITIVIEELIKPKKRFFGLF
ncbi:hypothetical protein [Acinetobacter bereziniae]|uniref:hypothetical protein n=1 Tax=Acinetobacter bereziniae TaxID=106648 RepID=UPI0012506001|nr:hypothetical protein [Acinetobacter bereziniae]